LLHVGQLRGEKELIMKKGCFVLLLCILLPGSVLLAGGKGVDTVDWSEASFEEIEEAARATKVSWYMWGGSSIINKWVDDYVAEELESRYDITLERVPMDASIFVNKLLTEKQAGRTEGTIDLLWINGENFKNAMESGLLFGPFAGKLPNFVRNMDESTVEYDFGYPTEGYEAPYGRAQFVFEYDTARVAEPPDTYDKLLEWVKNNPGRFTYPQPPDFTGSAFIRQVFYAVTGGHQQYMKGFDRDLFDRNARKLWDYLNALEPYLWQEGKSYPKDVATLDTLFARGEVDLNMTYHQAHAQNSILTGLYQDTVRSFVMKDGSIYNTHFVAVPYNAPNKPGAMVVANFLLSVEAQVSKNDPENWGDFTVLDMTRLSDQQRLLFESINLGEATIPLDILSEYGVPEIPSPYLEELEVGWENQVLRR
jgi:putative spermidine/putrescine transport system substrate-binding protein